MANEVPVDLIETLMSLGFEDKQSAQHQDELIASLKSAEAIVDKYTPEDWQNLCDTLSRESHIQLFRGLVFAGIFAWGPCATAPVKAVFSGLNSVHFSSYLAWVMPFIALAACEVAGLIKEHQMKEA